MLEKGGQLIASLMITYEWSDWWVPPAAGCQRTALCAEAPRGAWSRAGGRAGGDPPAQLECPPGAAGNAARCLPAQARSGRVVGAVGVRAAGAPAAGPLQPHVSGGGGCEQLPPRAPGAARPWLVPSAAGCRRDLRAREAQGRHARACRAAGSRPPRLPISPAATCCSRCCCCCCCCCCWLAGAAHPERGAGAGRGRRAPVRGQRQQQGARRGGCCRPRVCLTGDD